MNPTTHFISLLATASRESIETHQLARLQAMFLFLAENNTFQQRRFRLAEMSSNEVYSLEALHHLPFTTKAELSEDQLHTPPFGTNLSFPPEQYTRLHQTSGTTGAPLRWLDTAESWTWLADGWRQVYLAAGIEASDRIFFTFSFGPFASFWSAWAGAEAVGALLLSGGSLSVSQRLHSLLELEATVLVSTPTYALHLAEVARREGIVLHDSPVHTLIVSGETGGSIPHTRAQLERAWGAAVYDHAGITEVGAFSFSCQAGALHVNEAEFIAEVVTPQGTLANEGELVLTNLGRWGSPAVRYRTGDAVRLQGGQCPCGSFYTRLDGGIHGRVDDMLIVRGINLFPSAVENIVREYEEVGEWMIEVSRRAELDTLRLLVEVAERDTDHITLGLSRTISEQLMLNAAIVPVELGSLPRWETNARRVRDLREQ